MPLRSVVPLPEPVPDPLGRRTTFVYDEENRLVAVVDPVGTRTTVYDEAGNVTSITDQRGNPTVGPNNRLESDGTWDYSHDDEGNRTEKANPSTGDTWWYSYDNANRLVFVEYAQVPPVGPYVVSTIGAFEYDVFGNRIQSEIDADGVGGSPSVVSQFAYDLAALPPGGGGLGGGAHLWADLDDAGSLTTRRIFGDAIDQLFARIEDEELDWYGTDRLGSVRLITDSSGAVLDQIDYDAFGNITSESNPSNGDRYQWTGREFDEATGLYHYPYRPFDPLTARFLTEDPLGFTAGDTNLGRYTRNNPTNFTDPLGLEALGVGEYGPELLSPGSSYQPPPALSSNLPPLSSSPLDGVDLSPLLPADLTVQFPENNLGPLAIGEGRRQGSAAPAWQERPRLSVLDQWNQQLRMGLPRRPERGNDAGRQHTQSQLRIPGLKEDLLEFARARGPAPYDQNGKRLLPGYDAAKGYGVNEQGLYVYSPFPGRWEIPCVVCHGRGGSWRGLLPGMTPTDNFALGRWRNSGSNANIIRNYSAGIPSGFATGFGETVNFLSFTGRAAWNIRELRDGGLQELMLDAQVFDTDAWQENIEGWANADRDSLVTQAGRHTGMGLEFAAEGWLTGKAFGFGQQALRRLGPVGRVTELSRLSSAGRYNPLSDPYGPLDALPTGGTTTQALLQGNFAAPGATGVTLNQQAVRFADIWALTEKYGRVEFGLTREVTSEGRKVYRLYSGGTRSVSVPNTVYHPTHPRSVLRRIAHTHPNGDPYPSFPTRGSPTGDITNLNNDFLNMLLRNPYSKPPHSRIIWGPGATDSTIYYPTILR